MYSVLSQTAAAQFSNIYTRKAKSVVQIVAFKSIILECCRSAGNLKP